MMLQVRADWQKLTSNDLENMLILLVNRHVGDVQAEVSINQGIEELRSRRLARSAG